MLWMLFGLVNKIITAHSYLQLPNSAGQFAQFHGLPQENCENSMAYHGFPFMSKLRCLLFTY